MNQTLPMQSERLAWQLSESNDMQSLFVFYCNKWFSSRWWRKQEFCPERQRLKRRKLKDLQPAIEFVNFVVRRFHFDFELEVLWVKLLRKKEKRGCQKCSFSSKKHTSKKHTIECMTRLEFSYKTRNHFYGMIPLYTAAQTCFLKPKANESRENVFRSTKVQVAFLVLFIAS